jgi:hypothetical protein
VQGVSKQEGVLEREEGVLKPPSVLEEAVEDQVEEVLLLEAVSQEVLQEGMMILQVCCHLDKPWDFL